MLFRSVFIKQIEELKSALARKANLSEVADNLQKRITKEELSVIMERKVDIKDFEIVIGNKVDSIDLQKLVGVLEHKAEMRDMEIMQKTLERKLAEIESWKNDPSNKVTTKDLDIALASLTEAQRMERESLAIDLEKTINIIRKEVKDDLEFVKKYS